MSLDGELKISWLAITLVITVPNMCNSVLDPKNIRHDPLHHSTITSEILLDFPILAEAIEEMMLSRYNDTSEGERWSEDARNFLSCTLSGSLKSLMKVNDS